MKAGISARSYLLSRRSKRLYLSRLKRNTEQTYFPGILALLLLLAAAANMRAADRETSRISLAKISSGESTSADNIPDAPGSSNLPDTVVPRPATVPLPVVRYTPRLRIPHLSGDPRLNDFLTTIPNSKPAREMLRVNKFLQRFPQDGHPVTEPTVAYMG